MLTQGRDRSSEEADVYEAVFRFLIARGTRLRDGPVRETPARKAPTEKERRHRVAFLAVNGKDPNSAFLRRFADVPLPVKRLSDGEFFNSYAGYNWRDRRTRQRGIVYRAGGLRWRGEAQAEVEGGYSSGVRSGLTGRFALARGGGKWHVVRVRMLARH